jgi:ABC-type Na+ efflux pump permease subunit
VFDSDGRRPRIAIAGRELSSLKREKTIVLALLIQLFVAAFSSFLVVGLTSLYDPGSIEGGEIAVGVSGEKSEDLAAAASAQRTTRPVSYADREAAMAAFDDGSVQAVLHGTTLSTDRGTRIHVQAVVPAGNLRTTVVVTQVRRVLSGLEATARDRRSASLEVTPLSVPDRVDASPYFGFTYTVLIPLLCFLPPFISGSVAVDSVTEEVERGTLELLRVAPVSIVDIVDGKALAMIALAPAQVLLWIALLAANGIGVANPIALVAFVTAVTTLVVAAGVAIALATRRRRRAQLLYSTSVLVLFALAAGLPEHPATTVAKLAVDSATLATLGHVGMAVGLAAAVAVAVRRAVGRTTLESLR